MFNHPNNCGTANKVLQTTTSYSKCFMHFPFNNSICSLDITICKKKMSCLFLTSVRNSCWEFVFFRAGRVTWLCPLHNTSCVQFEFSTGTHNRHSHCKQLAHTDCVGFTPKLKIYILFIQWEWNITEGSTSMYRAWTSTIAERDTHGNCCFLFINVHTFWHGFGQWLEDVAYLK